MKLKNLLLEAETFTATNKASGKTSVFKSKDSRDAAIKSGTHNPIKDTGDSNSKGSETPKVNIFDKPTKSNDDRSEKIKSKEELYSKFDSLQNNPDALLKFMNTEILPNYDHRTKTSIDYVRGEIENLKNPKASTSKKNKSKENIKQILTNVINYNLEKVAEKRAVSKGWPDRDEYLANNNSASNKKANLSNMKSKDELYSAIDSLTGEKFEEYVLKEVVPYLDNSILLNTLFINANSINKDDKTYEPFLKKMVKNEIESTINPKDTSIKKSKKALSSDKQINFGDFESLDGINYSTDVSDLIDSNEKIFSKEDINNLYSLQSNLEQAEQDMDDDGADETLDSIHTILKKYMTETKGRISLSKLLSEETFTATNKATGKTAVFKSKDSRDNAIKAGTHAEIEKDKDSTKASKSKVNIFDKPASEPSDSKSSTSTPSNMGVDKVVYNTRTKTVGIVRMADERGETKTDADGNVNTSELEPYNPMKYPHQKDAKVAPSTEKEIGSRGLWTPFAQDKTNDEPKLEPTTTQSKKRPGNPQVNKEAKKKAEEYGITPQKLGNDKYKEAMLQAVVSALTDSNYHSEARELVAAIEGKPEWAKRPVYPSLDDPKFKEKMANIRNNSADSSIYMNAKDEVDEYGTDVSQASGWDGVQAADAIAFTLRMNGFHKQADLIQSIFDNKPYMKALNQEGRISLTKMVNESETEEIANLTGLRTQAVKKFIDDNNIDDRKLLAYLKIKGPKTLSNRMDISTAIVGKPGNKFAQGIIKAFQK
jgi:hypothetical protein